MSFICKACKKKYLPVIFNNTGRRYSLFGFTVFEIIRRMGTNLPQLCSLTGPQCQYGHGGEEKNLLWGFNPNSLVFQLED
jgi:hypothetical protein